MASFLVCYTMEYIYRLYHVSQIPLFKSVDTRMPGPRGRPRRTRPCAAVPVEWRPHRARARAGRSDADPRTLRRCARKDSAPRPRPSCRARARRYAPGIGGPGPVSLGAARICREQLRAKRKATARKSWPRKEACRVQRGSPSPDGWMDGWMDGCPSDPSRS